MSKNIGLCDILQYAYFVDDGILITKDGSFLVTYRMEGASDVSRAYDLMLKMLNRLSAGWVIYMDHIRLSVHDYPSALFPNSISQALDDERKFHFLEKNQYFTNQSYLSWIWKFHHCDLEQSLSFFQQSVQDHVELLHETLCLNRLSSKDLASFLYLCMTGQSRSIEIPSQSDRIDLLLSNDLNIKHDYLIIGDQHHIGVINVHNYLQDHSESLCFDQVSQFPSHYRWSQRFVALDAHQAKKIIHFYEKNWSNQSKGLWNILRSCVLKEDLRHQNLYELSMLEENEKAKLDAEFGVFGYWNASIILYDTNDQSIRLKAQQFSQSLESIGLLTHRETLHLLDAWIGSIPGHVAYNIRKMIISGKNFSHFLNLKKTWIGQKLENHYSFLRPKQPLFYASTSGYRPFTFEMDVEDVGHQWVIGPTGSGKSMWVSLMCAQFLRYTGAKIFIFDKDESHASMARALSGSHIRIDHHCLFCPFENLDHLMHRMNIERWIQDCLILRGIDLTPSISQDIHQTLELMAKQHHLNHMSLFLNLVQNTIIKQALADYRSGYILGVFDGLKESLSWDKNIQVFEMGFLMNQRSDVCIPTLHYLFYSIEKWAHDALSRPVLIVLEEAWLYLQNPVFQRKVVEWLKTFRKKNIRVVFVTQSISDLDSSNIQNMTESCATKIFLPNPSANHDSIEGYRSVGLSDDQIHQITQNMQTKKHYMVVQKKEWAVVDLKIPPDSVMHRMVSFLNTENS